MHIDINSTLQIRKIASMFAFAVINKQSGTPLLI